MAGVTSGEFGGDQVVVYGEVLFDQFPDGSAVLGGAPFNVAWNLRALGVDPLFVSRVGNDELGARILESMTLWAMRTDGLQVDDCHATGTVEVEVVDGQPSFDIVADRAYDHIDERAIPAIEGKPLLYHGSLVCRGYESRRALQALIDRCRPRIFVDVNLRFPWWEADLIHVLLRGAREVKLNEDELRALIPGQHRVEDQALRLLSRFAIERLHVTRGSLGALSFSSEGECREVRPESGVEVVDTVGAGDAFASVLILGQLMDWSLQETLTRAQELAAAIVGLRGATTTDRSFYKRFREAWTVL
jgi:fructokinase